MSINRHYIDHVDTCGDSYIKRFFSCNATCTQNSRGYGFSSLSGRCWSRLGERAIYSCRFFVIKDRVIGEQLLGIMGCKFMPLFFSNSCGSTWEMWGSSVRTAYIRMGFLE